jgi:hypothetical protein
LADARSSPGRPETTPANRKSSVPGIIGFEKAVHETAREKRKGEKDGLVEALRSEGSKVNKAQHEERV